MSKRKRKDSYSEDDNHELKEDNNKYMQEKVTEELRIWAVSSGIPHIKLDELLKIFKNSYLPNLPASSKTFLESNQKFEIEEMESSCVGKPGQFYYFGLTQKLQSIVNTDLHPLSIVEIIIFVDGISPFKNSTTQCWPILAKVYDKNDYYKPFTVAIYAGKTKPKDATDYCLKLVNELNILQSVGLTINNKNYKVKVKFFLSDTPARSFMKCVMGHTSLKACERCNILGEKIDHVTVFKSTDSEKKTNEKFRLFSDPDYHTSYCILNEIKPEINLLYQWVLDPMHLLYLGVTKRLLEFLLTSKSNDSVKMSAAFIKELSRRTKMLEEDIPIEFLRKMRDTSQFSNYKAVEFKFFSQYVAPFVFKNWLNEEMYNHFMLFTVAIRLLSQKNALNYTAVTRKYLKEFVTKAEKYYGSSFMSLNVHNLLHLVDDVEFNKCNLNELSAFCFESYLSSVSKSFRCPKNLVAQYCRRSVEQEKFLQEEVKIQSECEILKVNNEEQQILKIKFKEVTLTTEHPNNTVILDNNEIAEIVSFKKKSDKIQVETKKYLTKTAVFDKPCNSTHLNIFEISNQTSEISVHFLEDIQKKCVKFNLNYVAEEEKKMFVVPILH